MAMDSRFHKVELMLGERAAHRQPTARLGTVKNSPDCLFDQDCLLEMVCNVIAWWMNNMLCVWCLGPF